MHRLFAIVVILAGLLAGAVGCHSPAPDGVSFHHWGWEDAKDAKAHLDEYNHIFLACVYEDHWEDRSPHSYSFYHCKATVIRTYKGDWRTSERVSFVQGVDYRVPKAWNSNAGKLVFFFINEHTDTEIGADPGHFSNYDSKLERILEFLFAEPKSR